MKKRVLVTDKNDTGLHHFIGCYAIFLNSCLSFIILDNEASYKVNFCCKGTC